MHDNIHTTEMPYKYDALEPHLDARTMEILFQNTKPPPLKLTAPRIYHALVQSLCQLEFQE